MKAPYYTVFILIFLCSCTKPNYYQPRINDIPTKSPNCNSEIRFGRDRKPNRPYFEIIDFDIIEKGRLTKNQVKKKLETEAITEGVDAVIGVDYWHNSRDEISIMTVLIDLLDDDNEPTTTNANYTHILGRGIMYLDNLDYINTQPEFEYFYKVDAHSDVPEPFFKIEYKLTGQVYTVYPETDVALEIFKKYFQNYSDYHLLRQREMWTFTSDGGQLKKRVLRNETDYITKICVPKYDRNNRMVQLKIMNRSNDIHADEYIHYSYNDQGKLTNRLVEIFNGAKVYEEYVYEAGLCSGRKIILSPPTGRQIRLNSSIRYFDPDYLKDLYFHERVQKD